MPASPSRYERTRCYRRGWVFERVGWAAMAAVVVAAAAGLFGNGWLSSVRATAETLSVEYPRFSRARAPLELKVEWSAPQPETVLWIARSYVDRFDVDRIQPTPVATTAGAERIYYAFRAHEAGTRVAATFTLRPRSAGALEGRLGVERGPEIEARQWVFP